MEPLPPSGQKGIHRGCLVSSYPVSQLSGSWPVDQLDKKDYQRSISSRLQTALAAKTGIEIEQLPLIQGVYDSALAASDSHPWPSRFIRILISRLASQSYLIWVPRDVLQRLMRALCFLPVFEARTVTQQRGRDMS